MKQKYEKITNDGRWTVLSTMRKVLLEPSVQMDLINVMHVYHLGEQTLHHSKSNSTRHNISGNQGYIIT